MPNDVNTEIADRLTLHRLRLLRYEAGIAQRVLEVYDAALTDLNAQIARLSRQVTRGEPGAASLRRLRGLAIELRNERARAESRIGAIVAEGTEGAATAEAKRLGAILGDAVGISRVRVPEEQVVRALGGPVTAPWRDRLRADLVELTDSVGAVIARGAAQGASIPDIARMLRTVPGLVEAYRGRMVAIARTETQRAANEVALATYEANADVLSGVQWLATLDSRTCLRCAPRHAQVYPLVGGRPVGLASPPPLHPRCRCFLAPVTKGYAELGLSPSRANRTRYDGEPAREQTFDAWLRRQDVATQLEVLGPGRRDLWLGGASLASFSTGDRVIPLDGLMAVSA